MTKLLNPKPDPVAVPATSSFTEPGAPHPVVASLHRHYAG